MAPAPLVWALLIPALASSPGGVLLAMAVRAECCLVLAGQGARN